MSEADKTETVQADTALEPDTEQGTDSVKKATLIVLAICVILFVWNLLADRFTPLTDQARVQAYKVNIVPNNVSGLVTKINVGQNQAVEEGEVLLELDKEPYRIAVDDARSKLDQVGQDIGAGTAGVATAQSQLVFAKAQLNKVQVQTDRVLSAQMLDVISDVDADKARAELAKALADVSVAEAELERAKQQLGESGRNNPRVRSALALLEQAELDLENTSIRAPSNGGITNLQIDEGQFATAGSPLMTFISIDEVWLEADLRENNLGNMAVGNPVEIALDVAPGMVFDGTVTSIGFGVSSSKESLGDLPTIDNAKGWLRESQRFRVIIGFSDQRSKGYRRVGGQADVIVYTGNSFLLNGVGWVWIRILSLLSYAY
jgi:multidrug resistance efflux pump